MNGDIHFIQQQTLVRLIDREDIVAIGEDKEFKLTKLANEMTGIARCHCMVVDTMNKILNVAVAFQKEYNEKLVATGIFEIVKHMIGSHFLTEMSTPSYYRHIPCPKISLRHDSFLLRWKA